MNDKQKIALENDVLHAEPSNFNLFYNRDYDLGKHLIAPGIPVNNEHFTLSKMNVTTKNITPPDTAPTTRKFLFIK